MKSSSARVTFAALTLTCTLLCVAASAQEYVDGGVYVMRHELEPGSPLHAPAPATSYYYPQDGQPTYYYPPQQPVYAPPPPPPVAVMPYLSHPGGAAIPPPPHPGMSSTDYRHYLESTVPGYHDLPLGKRLRMEWEATGGWDNHRNYQPKRETRRHR